MDKKMTLTEVAQISDGTFIPFDIYEIPIDELKKQYVDYSIDIPISQYSNQTYKNVIEEVIKTTPIAETVEYMRTTFFFQDWQCLMRKAWNDVDVALIIPNIGQNESIIVNAMMEKGYFRGPDRQHERDGMNWLQIQFEPYESKSLKDEVIEDEVLYHVTPYVNTDSILTKGILPTDENLINGLETSNRPKLIFLLRGYTGYVQWKNTAIAINNKRPRNLQTDRFAVFKVDTSKLPEDIDFQGDPEHPSGICTYSIIPANSLSLMTEFTI